MSTLRALIVDDEPLARTRIRELLEADDGPDDVTVAGEAEDGEEAVEKIQTLAPDLVFLDVQMPGLSGLDVVEAVGPADMPLTIFVTAYDQYALNAFDVAAVDYLLKPFDDERFATAVARARKRRETRAAQDAIDTFERLLAAHRTADGDEAAPGDRPSANDDADDSTGDVLERIAVQGRGKTRIVPVGEVTHVTAEGSYVKIHTADDSYLIRERMKTLANRLPDAFMRIHRSAIVRLDAVKSILQSGGGDYAVRLHTGPRLSLSRSRVDELRERLGVQP